MFLFFEAFQSHNAFILFLFAIKTSYQLMRDYYYCMLLI